MARTRVVRYIVSAVWFLLLLLPSATTFSAGGNWDANPTLLLAVSFGFYTLLWLLSGSRWFFVLTCPLAFLGVMVVAADQLRGADLVTLALMSAGDPREAHDALAPYFVPMALTFALLAAVAAVAFRWPQPAPPRRVRMSAIPALVVTGAVTIVTKPAIVLRAWPLNVASVNVAAAIGRPDFISTALPYAHFNPRSPTATWSAHRDHVPAGRETYVILVGESVRADRLAACGGPQVLALRHQAQVYCDVTSGSSSTHTSVPLLLSREMPGGTLRVSSDATVLRAFEEAGFRTYWLSMQTPAVAWPDANVSRYSDTLSTGRATLVPQLRAALAEPGAKKVIVLHSYDAHYPYCQRYDPKSAPFPIDCRALGLVATRDTREPWLRSYDNAVAETLAYIDAVISTLDGVDGEALVAYTSDHGENLADDERELFNHSLATVTRFDTRVPFIFWENGAWRKRHRAEVEALAAHRSVAAMHADLVPTLLGAAGIRYAEPRNSVADLAHARPPPRTRWIEPRLGETVDGDGLR